MKFSKIKIMIEVKMELKIRLNLKIKAKLGIKAKSKLLINLSKLLKLINSNCKNLDKAKLNIEFLKKVFFLNIILLT